MDARLLDTFTKQYIETALWSSTDDNDDPLDATYTAYDIAEETLCKMMDDCAKFQATHSADIVLCDGNGHENLARAGHDFWLTRNGHGAGFWDGDWPDELGKRLTAASHSFGEFNLYVGDDGVLYGS